MSKRDQHIAWLGLALVGQVVAHKAAAKHAAALGWPTLAVAVAGLVIGQLMA